MGTKNANLHSAKRAKNDEFYTQLTDIEKEVVHYKDHFKDKIVLCNCNDALHTNFAKYFSLNFEWLGLKQLICTSFGENAKAYIYNGDKNGNHIPDLEEWDQIELKENGDFRSGEMIELLKKADIVCTNPPFSQFREYVAQLVEYDKEFLIIGNMNAITYKEIFPLITENKMWLGYKNINTDMAFKVPQDSEEKSVRFWVDENGEKWRSIGNGCWFTNLDHQKRHQPLDLYKHYNEEEYPKYDNYNAINVDKVTDIPLDYDGVMGVPITFLDKYCPTQFQIVGFWNAGIAGENLGASYCEAISKGNTITWNGPTVKKQTKYFRVLIKKL